MTKSNYIDKILTNAGFKLVTNSDWWFIYKWNMEDTRFTVEYNVGHICSTFRLAYHNQYGHHPNDFNNIFVFGSASSSLGQCYFCKANDMPNSLQVLHKLLDSNGGKLDD